MRPLRSSAIGQARKPPRLEPNKRLRHQQILDAAFEEFSARGYEAARLDDVAKRAGIAKGTIYLYFKNKELLFRAVLRDLITHVVEDLEELVQKFTGSAEDLIRELLSRQYSQVVGNAKARSILRLLISESRNFPQLAEIYYRDVILPGISALRLILEKGASSSEFAQTNIAEFPQILIAPGVLAVVWSLILGERHPLDLEGYKEAHLQFVLAGLRGTGRSATSATVESAARREAQ
jgi:AcrR family transcriptional regulator